jgi:uncharacterized protein YbjT (DUF2867 family)
MKNIMKVVINTPAGNVGLVVTNQLLQAKEEAVIISRHPENVKHFVARGACLVEGSIDDPLVLDRALKGADILYWATEERVYKYELYYIIFSILFAYLTMD